MRRKLFKTPERDEILHGPALRTMAKIGLPAVLSMVVFAMYNLADAMWLGRLPGTGAAALAAIQVSWPFIWLVISFVTGFGGAAVTALVAQHLGAGQPREANYAMNQLFTVSVISGFVLGIVGYALTPEIVSILVIDADVAAEASTYLGVIFLGLPTMMLPGLFFHTLSATGDTVTPLLINGSGTLLNIFLDGALINGWGPFPKMGILGAAVATVSAQGVATILFLVLFRKGIGQLRLDREALRLRWKWMWKALRIGFPAGAGSSLMAVGFMALMGIIGRLDNAKFALAGYGAADRLFGLLFIATNGLGMGLTTMIGQALGADLKDRARELMRKGVRALFVVLIVETLFVYLLRTPLVTFFLPHEPDAIREGTRFIELFAAGMPLLGVFFAAEAVYRGSGWNIPMTVIGVLRLVIRLAIGWFLAFPWGLQSDGIWIGMSASNVICGLISIPLLTSRRWMRPRIHAEKSEDGTAES
ncbi:MATE family efflux transporter [Candidatus Bipolaricaulota bacterium]